MNNEQTSEEEIAKLRIALRDLVNACSYVSPIIEAVASTDIRVAGKFIKAVENAKRYT